MTSLSRLIYHTLRMQTSYSIYEAKARLSEIIRQVQKKRRIILTHRGIEVAQILPVEMASDTRTRLQQLEQDGILSPYHASSITIKPLKRKKGALKRFLDSRE